MTNLNVGSNSSTTNHLNVTASAEQSNVILNLRSYKQHSRHLDEINRNYKELMEENEKLKERIINLKKQYTLETSHYR